MHRSHFSLIAKPKVVFRFPLFFLLSLSFILLSSCNSTTKPRGGSLAGRVILVNDTEDPSLEPMDFSGVTIALYEFTKLDTSISRINLEYPGIGVHINQETEFDHRLQVPTMSTTSNDDGIYKFENVNPGDYILVALKDGWDVYYNYHVKVSLEENNNSDHFENVIKLYPVTLISGTMMNDMIFQANRTYIVDEDAILLGNCSLSYGARIFIKPSRLLSFYGSVIMFGDDGNYLMINSADGIFSVDIMEAINPFNRVLLSGNNEYNVSKLIVENGTDGIRLVGASCNISNSIIRKMESSSISFGTGQFQANNIIVQDNPMGLSTQASGTLNNSIFLRNDEGAYIDDVEINLNNCYFMSNYIGIRCLYGSSILENNVFDKNRYAVSICAANPTLKDNKFYFNNTDIEMNRSWISYHVYQYCSPIIEDNNFYGDNIYISLYGKNIIGGSSATQGVGVNSDQHYPRNYYVKDNLLMHLFDNNHPGSNFTYTINYLPRRPTPNPIAGIQ